MREDRNHEGYPDPTAYQAIKRASRRRKRTYSGKAGRLTYKIGEVVNFYCMNV
jgi:hypothetical protein